MNDPNINISADGRITIVLFLMLGLLLFDLAYRSSTPFFAENSFCEQLHFVYPDKLAVESCRAAGNKQENTTTPARYSPFFYAAMPINSSNKDMLMTVKGIGPVLAEDIVTYRQQFGPFTSSMELLNLPGIGPKRAARLATVFTFGEVP